MAWGAGAGLCIGLYSAIKGSKNGKEFNYRQAFKIIACVGTGILGGRLSDLLEPAKNPNHRSFFHSYCFGAITILGMFLVRISIKSVAKNVDSEALEEITTLTDALGYGVLTHLFLDAQTKRGLPIFKTIKSKKRKQSKKKPAGAKLQPA